MWPYPINWLNVPKISYKMCIQGASHGLKWIPFELPCPMKCAKLKLFVCRPEETHIFCPMKCKKFKLFLCRPEETQMSSDEFRVTQHVMKTIKDEMPAIVRSMVFWFFRCSVSAFELRIFLWYSLIRLIICMIWYDMIWLPDQICHDILPDEDCHDCGRSHLCSDQVHYI